jgi:hypothetical protein
MIRVESKLLDANIPIPTSVIQKFEPNRKGEFAFELVGGDRITGRIAGGSISADALFGRIDIPAKFIRSCEATHDSLAEDANDPGNFQLDYAGLRWDLWRTGWKVVDGELTSQRYIRPGFQYGHWGHGRGGLAITGNGDQSWTDYEVAFDYKMFPANREFFHAHIPGDSRGLSILLRAKSVSESWNEPSTHYTFSLRPTGNWGLAAFEGWHMTGRGYNAARQEGKYERLCSGESDVTTDASEGRLRLRVHGNTIAVWLNDELLCSHIHKGEEVKPILYGGFGVQWRYESMGSISNVTVKRH